jgi:hypothetical protein
MERREKTKKKEEQRGKKRRLQIENNTYFLIKRFSWIFQSRKRKMKKNWERRKRR